MILHINDNKTIADVQEKFQVFFPFLKIEFFEQPHHLYEASTDKAPYPSNVKLADIRKNHAHGDMKIHSWFKTGDLEQEFRKKFGLNVQVLRLHGDAWVQTAGTDNLDLKEQNEIACKATLECREISDSKTAKRSLI